MLGYIRFLRSSSLGLAAAAALTFAGAMAASCDGTSDETTGKRVVLQTRAELGSEASFTNAFGWEITLDRVLVSSGALYYFSGAPIESEAWLAPAPVEPGLLQLLAPRSAHAHPGHYAPGDARGEVLESTTFDLMAGPVQLPAGVGITGVVRSGRFTWGSPPKGPAAGELGGDVALVEGTAIKGELTKVFRLSASETEVHDASGVPVVEGCTFHEVDVQADGVVTVRLDPSHWLDQAEFDDVADSDDGEPIDVPADDPAAKAFVRALKQASAITFTYSTES